MKTLKIACLFACIILLVSCLDNNTGPEPTVITDPSATSHLYIANQSEIDLSVTYKTTDSYGGIDSTLAAPADSTTLIFEPGGFSFSTPSEALTNLRFYNPSDDTTSPLFTIEPVIDEHWNDVTAESDTVRKYELAITDEDIE